ncbi:glycosyltransferase [Pediococcus inopinatus]|uniref:glycosyltransferase n=1 Tax=Pediococcus inopinatus TaxID=114090 RepID=UPI002B258600|nr:glycosyltransferase [Pediococcus inopinatus]WPC18761.1 glycosyltransferase [Pediococcus inopinatus]
MYTGLMSIFFKEKPGNLNESFTSILNQTLLPNEMVLIKDGVFGDELDRVLKNFVFNCAKKNIPVKIIKHNISKGLGLSLNEGLRRCSYNYVARFDSDDINLTNRMQRTIKAFDIRDDVSVIGTNVEEFNPGNKSIKKKVPLRSNEILKFSRFRNPMNHMSVTFKKDDVEAVGGYEDVPYFEDYYLWLKMLKKSYQFLNLDDILVSVRVDDDFYHRRGGIQYVKKECKFQFKIYKEGYISIFRCILNIFFRGTPRLLPKTILAFIYKVVRSN